MKGGQKKILLFYLSGSVKIHSQINSKNLKRKTMTRWMRFFLGVPPRVRVFFVFFFVFKIYYRTFWRFMTSVQPLWSCKMCECRSVCECVSVGALEHSGEVED